MSEAKLVPASGSAPCPNCFGGYFRPCNWCCDTGRVEYIPPSPAQVRKELIEAGINPDEAWRTFQRDVLKSEQNNQTQPTTRAATD